MHNIFCKDKTIFWNTILLCLYNFCIWEYGNSFILFYYGKNSSGDPKHLLALFNRMCHPCFCQTGGKDQHPWLSEGKTSNNSVELKNQLQLELVNYLCLQILLLPTLLLFLPITSSIRTSEYTRKSWNSWFRDFLLLWLEHQTWEYMKKNVWYNKENQAKTREQF